MDFVIIAFLFVALDVLAIWGIRKSFPGFGVRCQRRIQAVFIIQALLALVFVMGGLVMKNQTRDYHIFTVYYYIFGFMIALYLPKVLFVGFMCVDILISAAYKRKRSRRFLPRREPCHIIAKLGMAPGVVLMGIIVCGIFFGRYHYTVEHVDISFSALPPAFDGFTIAQISDMHAGSFAGSTSRLRKAVDMINMQHPDLIVFTGDMVNNFAEEVKPLIPVLSQLKAPDGKYAVLGNHDYGIYYDWETPAEQNANLSDLKQVIASMGFRLLNNETVILGKDSPDSIALAGVENWGIAEHHPRKGNIVQTTNSIRHIPFKILLSHDPSFWTEKIAGKTDIALTLSGHTHGMQMGIAFGNRRYSPAQIKYKYWAGLHRGEGNQYLYVNRGLGVIGYPGRIGMPPEITVITLKRAQ
jgi:predicted MPP superfamily phosphohydrolase